MSDIKDWSTTAASNNANPPDGFPEGMAPSAVNNSARELMASVREYYDSPEWREWGHTIAYGSATTFTTAAGDGDTTAIYHANRRVKAFGILTTTIYGTIQSSAHTTQTTVTVTWDSGSLNNESLTIWIGVVSNVDHIPYSGIADVPANITSVSSGNLIAPTGTKLVFHNAASPTGWTIDSGITNHAVMLSNTSGGTSSGSVAFTTVFGRTATDNHTLTQAQMPNHFHTTVAGTPTVFGLGGSGGSGTTGGSNLSINLGSRVTSSAGSDNAHNHNIDMRTQYARCILASKD